MIVKISSFIVYNTCVYMSSNKLFMYFALCVCFMV